MLGLTRWSLAAACRLEGAAMFCPNVILRAINRNCFLNNRADSYNSSLGGEELSYSKSAIVAPARAPNAANTRLRFASLGGTPPPGGASSRTRFKAIPKYAPHTNTAPAKAPIRTRQTVSELMVSA